MEQALISRLQLRQPPGQRERLDALTARLRMGSLLEQLDLARVGLGPSAVLCIRRLEDPLPGTVALHTGALSPAWEAALRRSLEEQARRAARPAREMVPAGANAVLFADQAELLACLAADWCLGEWAQRWWWQSWLGFGDARSAVLAAWQSSPEYIPGAFVHLDRLHRTRADTVSAEDFVNRAGSAAARELLGAVLRVFGLPELLRVFDLSPLGNPPLTGRATVPSRSAGPESVSAGPSQREPPWQAEPWPGTASAADRAISRSGDPICQALVGTGLALAENPARVRTQAFLQQVDAWWARRIGFVCADAPPVQTEEIAAVTPHSGSEAALSAGLPLVEIASKPAATAPAQALEPVPDSNRILGEHSWQTAPVQAAEVTPPDQDALLQTDLGGLFYLVNVGLYLGLYADFTRPDSPGLDLSIWDFVTLLGQDLLGQDLLGQVLFAHGQPSEDAQTLRADPIWGLLAQLAGRGAADAPGAGFTPPETWMIPPAWLTALSPTTDALPRRPWHWNVAADRLRIEHPLGFPVLDAPLEGQTPAQWIDREWKRCSAGWGLSGLRLRHAPPRSSREDGQAFAGLPAPLARWLGWVTGYVRARLALALGPGFGSPRTEMARRLLLAPARLRLTAANVEVHLSLDSLPVEIRLAGLDRDPGWVPAAGRFIRFLFA